MRGRIAAPLSLTVGKLRAATGAALATLVDRLDDPSGTVAVAAARVILDTAVKVDVDDLRQRIERLEHEREDTPHAPMGTD